MFPSEKIKTLNIVDKKQTVNECNKIIRNIEKFMHIAHAYDAWIYVILTVFGCRIIQIF